MKIRIKTRSSNYNIKRNIHSLKRIKIKKQNHKQIIIKRKKMTVKVLITRNYSISKLKKSVNRSRRHKILIRRRK